MYLVIMLVFRLYSLFMSMRVKLGREWNEWSSFEMMLRVMFLLMFLLMCSICSLFEVPLYYVYVVSGARDALSGSFTLKSSESSLLYLMASSSSASKL